MLDRPHEQVNPGTAGLAAKRDEAMVRARGLSLEIDGDRLVDHVDLALPFESATVVVGPNGAGKSLLLRLLHGLITPSSGEIRYSGEARREAAGRRQAMVFQKPVMLRRSVSANIDFVQTGPRRERRVRRERLLEMIGLADKHRQSARLLSGGEQQRLALARALATDPGILFLDEPTASLDPASMATIERILADIRANGVKIVMVTHDLAQARRLADDIAFMHRGRILEHRPTNEFLDQPVCEQAAAFVEGRIVF